MIAGITRESDKVLIFVVAYNAGNHIRSVIDRLPREVFNNPDYHVLVIDDCSKDETAKTVSAHVSQYKYDNVTIVRNTINMGYGGNQKIGYRYAVQQGYGLVVLLHGDGQYAPELVLEFTKRWKSESADVVLGSRMLEKTNARAGGMPFYKWIGNQVLTMFQNRVVGSRLSEFHTGFRAYSTKFLQQVPFELNTNDFHFDTEILLQAFALDAKITEFPIPTHYGDEICHVNGMQYAWNVVKACLKYKFQKIGFFCSMQYRGLLRHDERYADKSQHIGSTHFHVVKSVTKPGRVLDLGCGPGFVAKGLKRVGCQVVGVDAVRAPNFAGDRFIQMDLEKETLREDISGYDYVLMLDVLEHLGDPEKFLINCRFSMGTTKQPKFIFSTGNVAFIGVRMLLGLGLFNYGERGILDVTHKRLFTLASFKRMLRETGYELTRVKGIGIPFELLFANALGRFMSRVSYALASVWPSLFSYQFLVEARPKPHSFMLLANAERFYDAPRAVSSLGVE